MKNSKEKNLDQPIYAPLLDIEVDNRWLIIKKHQEKWTLKELSKYTGIPKSTLASRTLGFNGPYSLLNSLFRDYILNKSLPNRIRNKVLIWATDNLELIGDNGILSQIADKDFFLSKGQERYLSRTETKDNLIEVVDYLQILRGDDEESIYDEPLNFKHFSFFLEALCQILSSLITTTKTLSTSTIS